MPIIDFHAHMSLQPYYMQIEKNGNWVPLAEFWARRKKKASAAAKILVGVLSPSTPMYSQTHLDSAIQGNVKCIVNPLYPIERGFLKPGSKNIHPKNLWDNVLALLSGADVRSVNRVQSKELSYFLEMYNEYLVLQQHQFPVTKPGSSDYYRIVSSYDELASNTGISIILAIEGGHALASNIYDSSGNFIDPIVAEQQQLPEFETYKTQLLDNIRTLKSWMHPTLYISPAHHYYSHLSGLSESIPIKFLIEKQKILINGVSVFDLGITPFGQTALELLLANQADGVPGRRILIDVKHFSPNARIDYYKMIAGRNIPVIASHTAVNGRSCIKDYAKKTSCRPFNSGNINLFDDEIVTICDSDGLIGIMLDEKRLYDSITEADIKHMRDTDPGQLRKMCLDVILYQIVHIAKVSGGKGFQHICLGSDFDGFINAIDFYTEFENLESLRNDLIHRIQSGMHHIKKKYITEKETLMSDPEKYVDAILYENTRRFLQKYFNDEYLVRIKG